MDRKDKLIVAIERMLRQLDEAQLKDLYQLILHIRKR